MGQFYSISRLDYATTTTTTTTTTTSAASTPTPSTIHSLSRTLHIERPLTTSPRPEMVLAL
ncbi:hypothetical protein E2C01_075504 [Portunus trituberculatus]|uniref:Uncharacterized protein n=1 Tax=Portunus trituberculatus TaxID=210409 RepID=A0A5B7IH79_PORTR|nr:hypothetical protein [Portunus trituberculatus]